MTALLILGSKPAPALPPANSYDALACANASGRSAQRYGLAIPEYTVISAIVSSGKKPANDLALQALRGLETRSLVVYPRPRPTGSWLRRGVKYLKNYKMNPYYLRWRLQNIGYRFGEYFAPSPSYFARIFERLSEGDPALLGLLRQKQPSTGIAALTLGIAAARHSKFILSGFSFEITHDYAQNPLIERRGSISVHASTDQAMLRHLSRSGLIVTTEPAVHDATGIPYL